MKLSFLLIYFLVDLNLSARSAPILHHYPLLLVNNNHRLKKRIIEPIHPPTTTTTSELSSLFSLPIKKPTTSSSLKPHEIVLILTVYSSALANLFSLLSGSLTANHIRQQQDQIHTRLVSVEQQLSQQRFQKRNNIVPPKISTLQDSPSDLLLNRIDQLEKNHTDLRHLYLTQSKDKDKLDHVQKVNYYGFGVAVGIGLISSAVSLYNAWQTNYGPASKHSSPPPPPSPPILVPIPIVRSTTSS